MRITPLEIRQKTFEKNFRGYEKDEVQAFLLTLSQEWERMLDENKELRIKLETTEREVQKLREVETSLFKTLKTAEDTGANVVEQARKAADLHLRESQLKADGLINEAKAKAKDTIEESESRAKQVLEEMEDRLKTMIENYKRLESSRENLLGDLKHMASEMLERVARANSAGKDFDPDKHLNKIRRETKKAVFPNVDYEKNNKPESPNVEKQAVLQDDTPDAEIPKKNTKSFFDEIG